MHTTRLLNTVACVIIYFSLSAQCPQGTIYFESQEDIQDFINDYPNCEALDELNVSGTVSDLTPLSNLKSVDYLYFESCTWLQSLEGMQNIDSISGNLGFYGHVGFSDLCGFDNLKYIGQDLRFEGTSHLKSTVGLNSLNYVEDDITMTENQDLLDINGLENIVDIGANSGGSHVVEISNNPKLSDCCGIQALLNNNTVAEFIISNNNEGCENEMVIIQSPCDFDYMMCGSSATKDDLNSELSIYPNPATHFFRINGHINSTYLIEIFDLTGRRINFEESNGNYYISSIVNGTYLVKIREGNHFIIKKLLVFD
ncbi:MAG TPA: T9SS type A sorting domain-containing protein [Saprospiraceae bacterium]|nr:T9SS type A sorting domain-containing protein [Saprospiraceae bacterium]MCB9329310.1 T9SS type A sorting domain-containing protein [Lewinellaceae bacterium]HPK09914.1 T9SS type A sorting domain-containing protein [Saprospiraceae bacterium]HPQ20817.1 T9SS type A sorting domain-containing protein [Saprospiraceae bacterium]